MKHYDCNHDCDALYEAYENGRIKGIEEMSEALLKKFCNAWDILEIEKMLKEKKK